MRHIGDLPTQEQAQRFVDYLLVEGFKTQFDQEDNQFAIWAIEEDEIDRIKSELEDFRADPDASKYLGHSGKAQKHRVAEEKANRDFRNRQVDVRTRWRQGGSGFAAGPVTKILIGISVLVALSTQLGSDENAVLFSLLYEKLVPVNNGFLRSGFTAIQEGEIWRLFTPMFIHFGPLHILFNMMWLYQLGSQIESRLTPLKYLSLILVISAISNTGEFLWGQYRDIFSIFGGMSGVVYGLLGYIWMKTLYAPEERYMLSRQTVNFMLIWLVLCMTGMMGNIANAAHFIGLEAGCALGYFPVLLKK